MVDDLMRGELMVKATVGRVGVRHDPGAPVDVLADNTLETVGRDVGDVLGLGATAALNNDHDRSLADAAANVDVVAHALLLVAGLAADVRLVSLDHAAQLLSE